MSNEIKRRRIGAVIFDMGGVLIPPPMQLWSDAGRQLGLRPGAFFETFFKPAIREPYVKLERGEMALTDFARIFAQELPREGLHDDFAARVSTVSNILGFNAPAETKPRDWMMRVVREVKESGRQVALLTNNWYRDDEMRDSLLLVDPSAFDVVVESCRVGMRKPEPRIYELVCQKLGVAPQQCAFLDDLEHNLIPAQEMGMYTIRVDDLRPELAVYELGHVLGLHELGGEYVHHPPSTAEVRRHMKLPEDQLYGYIRAVMPEFEGKMAVREFVHGQSNPTYHVRIGGRECVLRKKPGGKLLPSAHQIEREYRVMKALNDANVPTPKMLHLCTDDTVIGTPFYLMEYMPGTIYKNPSLPECTKWQRKKIYENCVRTLAKIHKVDLQKAGLKDFGKSDNYMRRNFERWVKQYRAAEVHIKWLDRLEEDASLNAAERAQEELKSTPTSSWRAQEEHVAQLISWLDKHLPTQCDKPTLVHGDYRVDNVVFDPYTLKALAVLDWELSTIGDPLSDLATFAFAHYCPDIFGGNILTGNTSSNTNTVRQKLREGFVPKAQCQRLNIAGLRDVITPDYGIPTAAELARLYSAETDRAVDMRTLEVYIAFVAFRFSSILLGVYHRYRMGTHSGAGKGVQMAGVVSSSLAQIGHEIVNAHEATASKTADTCLPVTPDNLQSRARKYYDGVKAFIDSEIIPIEQQLQKYASDPTTMWSPNPKLETLQTKAKEAGLWNLFIPVSLDNGEYGRGLANVEYAHICEQMGRCLFAPEVFNCQAPDTGNMEVLLKYGSESQKHRWLLPLLAGKTRSCFAMTEPAVASSDATNICTSIVDNGDGYTINGHKWYISGAGDPRCAFAIVMGKTNPNAARHRQQSMIIVPMNTPGVSIGRAMGVFGMLDAPGGHCEVRFDNVTVPKENLILGVGRGFEIAQGRLGPGRIHHCMRLIGHCERALELIRERAQKRVAFGKKFADMPVIRERVAESRLAVDQARLLVLKTAHLIDAHGTKKAAREISMIKAVVPRMACNVLDTAIQIYGAAGVSQDTPLAAMYAWARSIRIADGPDDVHIRQVAASEFKSKL